MLLRTALSFLAMNIFLFICQSAVAEAAYFKVNDGNPNQTFVIQLTDSGKIQQARLILSSQTAEYFHVMGYVVPTRTLYNPGWSYHLDTDTIEFFEFAVEVCDSSAQYLEEHLGEVGGAFLPGNIWCPWGSKLVEEVKNIEGTIY